MNPAALFVIMICYFTSGSILVIARFSQLDSTLKRLVKIRS